MWGQAVRGVWDWGYSDPPSVLDCCSFVHHHQDQAEVPFQEGMGRCCSRATHGCGTQSSLATGRRDEDRRLYQTPQSTYYMKNLFSNTFPMPLCILSHSEQQHLSPHIPQTGLWAAIIALSLTPHVPCDSLLGPPSPLPALPQAGTKSLPPQLQSAHAVGLACILGNRFLLLQVCPVPSSGWCSFQLALLDAEITQVIHPAAAWELSKAH